MKNVTVNGRKFEVLKDKGIQLNNGDLVLHYNRMGICLGAYLVVSFRDNKDRYHGDKTNSYCTFVNLDDGAFKFEERCSRHTTVGRVMSHINGDNDGGKSSCEEGQYIKVYRRDKYQMDLNFDEREEV